MLSVCGTQNMTCTEAWFTMNCTASGPVQIYRHKILAEYEKQTRSIALRRRIKLYQEYHKGAQKCKNKLSMHDPLLSILAGLWGIVQCLIPIHME